MDKVIASTVGGVLVAVITCPFDVVTRRMQAQKSSSSSSTSSILKNESQLYFRNSLDASIKIARNEGVSSLWRGLSPTLWMTVPATAFYFTFYQTLRDKVERSDTLPFWTAPLVAGPVARTTTVVLSSPLELVRTRIQAKAFVKSNSSSESTLNVLRNVIKSDGFSGLLRGIIPTLYRDVPFSALYWLLYEQTVLKLNSNRDINHSNNIVSGDIDVSLDNPTSFLTNFIAGAFSGATAAVLTHPFDVIKTRRQMLQIDGSSSLKKQGELKAVTEIVRNLIKDEGWMALSKGLLPRCAKVVPACAIMIASYEFFLGHLSRRRTLIDENKL